ncbi:DUF2721 domain-containing protein [Novipirellula artificiosorum]|uniref:DUF2721 domain-containing protein n=1 Tax=Novipirellula artificiosorum TaxID=2528016 RepID=A0A5C6DR09_9BACT|nr:DUF2721 domain-containing protein [Novipirellula artificiosorum]TWU39280.1 hypothetical protein Poly41_21030 [Novipirellula artificiosorum]
MSLHELIPILQFAIGPVILISGVGLILLSMTNRIGRVIDRARLLAHAVRVEAGSGDQERILDQLQILCSRARMIRAGIAFGVMSVLVAALLIISLFIAALFQLSIVPFIIFLFILCMVSLIVCLAFFIIDVNLSLTALWHEVPAEGQHR